MALINKLTAIANAIREKNGSTGEMSLDEMASAISSISLATSIVDKSITEISSDILTSIGAYAFYECNGLTVANLPSVTNIGTYAFYSCRALESADFPLVTFVPSFSFQLCSGLTTINFPLATNINQYAFQYCRSLTTVDLPLVTYIGQKAFDSCTNLITIILHCGEKICTLENANALGSTLIASGTGYIYVPDDLVDSYKAATNWSTYADQIKPLSEYAENTTE